MGVQGMQTAAQVSELEVPLHCRVAWLRKNYSYFEDEHREVLMDKLDALTKTSGKKVFAAAPDFLPTYKLSCTAMCCSPGGDLIGKHIAADVNTIGSKRPLVSY